MAGRAGAPQCMRCHQYHWPTQPCRNRCTVCWSFHDYKAPCDGQGPPPSFGQPLTTNAYAAGYGQQSNTSSAFGQTLPPGPGWFTPSQPNTMRRQGASGQQGGQGSKGGKRKRDAAEKAEKNEMTGPAQGPKKSKQTRREKREKTAKEAEESARQRVEELERETAKTDQLSAELDVLIVSGQNPDRVTQLLGLIRESRTARETAKKQEQDKLLKEYEAAVKKQQRLEEELRQVHDLQRSIRARMDQASLSTLAGANLALRPADQSQQALAEAVATALPEDDDEDMKDERE